MADIKTFSFDKNKFDEIKAYKFGRNWPVVYIMKNEEEIYIGQTVNAYYRSKQHSENPERLRLKDMHIITDEEFNISAALDIESWLIQYIAADGKYIIQNGNGGLKNHNYYDKVKYKTKFEIAWDNLREKGIVKNTLEDLKNSDLFKYSPYKSLTEDQFSVAKKIFKDIKENPANTIIVNGKPGTGKTILATYLFKYLKEQEETKNHKIGLIVPMASLRKTIGKVFSKIKGLKSNMVLGPNDVVKDNYDILIVDESHRLQRRKGIMGYQAYDNVNKKLGLNKEATQLEWIVQSSKHQIFLYDENQSIKPADIRSVDFKNLKTRNYQLSTQMRVEAGVDFINFIEDIFDFKVPGVTDFSDYDFRLFDNAEEMVNEIKLKDKQYKLSRVVAGYAWPWHTKPGSKSTQAHDIEIGELKLIWNSTAQDWVNSKNAINEVGCIHTVQGYDLNYVGVIIGPEFYYDPVKNKFCVDREKYFDTNGRNGITDPSELEKYVINIYKTLLTRGIKGTYIYIVDENLRNYFKKIMTGKKEIKEKVINEIIKSPYTGAMVDLPLYESVGCGELMKAHSISEETISVRKSYLSGGSKYFVLRVTGDSMNKAGINDGDLVLCVKNYHPEVGNKVVALIGDDATIKEYRREGDAVVLKPNSTNTIHKPLVFTDNEEMSVQAVVVKVLKKDN